MIKFENTDVYGFDAAIRGMRNPMNSWDKSDSRYEPHCETCPTCGGECFKVGKDDLALMRMLAFAGDDHGKFARLINVTVDITAPLYWWKEFDTYKVGTVSNSCSTMHKLMDKPFEASDFSLEKVQPFDSCGLIDGLLELLNDLRNIYINYDIHQKTHVFNKNIKSKKDVWYILIQLLPSSYNQRRTVQLNYQVLNRIYRARQNHKLDEWHAFCDWLWGLPYFKEIYGETQA